MNLALFAHSEDQHTNNTSDLEHLLTEPYVAIPLFFALTIVIYILMNEKKVSLGRQMVVFMGYFLVIGIASYNFVSAISVISLTAGIFLALFFVLTSLSN